MHEVMKDARLFVTLAPVDVYDSDSAGTQCAWLSSQMCKYDFMCLIL